LLDVGCGVGLNVAFANECHGYTAYGIEGDGDALIDPVCGNLFKHDFEHDGKLNIKEIPEQVDLIWSVSVSEHIEEDKVHNYMDVFKRGKYIIFTWCPLDWPGFHHVNCQEAPYWIDKFRDIGFKLDTELTRVVKTKSDLKMIKSPHWRDSSLNNKQVSKMYLREWGLCFTRI
jgi:SAM-dependent methyltransferase